MSNRREEILKEAKRLYDLGWAVHWIRPNSKAPVKSGWNKPVRDTWEVLEKEFRDGYGLGTQMGEASRLENGYLANIDIDLKSGDPKFHVEAMKDIDRLFPGLRQNTPCVKTGYGFRYFVQTKEPVRSEKLGQASETTKVFMPNSEISELQRVVVTRGKLTQEELEKGFRIRPAWEIELMSSGRQVVLPPTIHPDTKKAYAWVRPVVDNAAIKLVGTDAIKRPVKARKEREGKSLRGFIPVEVDLVFSSLSDEHVEMIQHGRYGDKQCSDRSSFLHVIAKELLKDKFSEQEILSVLTDRDYFLGKTAYDHRKTSDRAQAAQWVQDYTLEKAKREVLPEYAFEVEYTELPRLSSEEAEAQFKELVSPTPWEDRLSRSKPPAGATRGKILPTVNNCLLILRNAVSPKLVKRNLFSFYEHYGVDTPWNRKANERVEDRDFSLLLVWMAENFGIEPPPYVLMHALTKIADENEYHPIREYLLSLPRWDLIPRVDTWLKKHYGAEGPDEYLAQALRKWLLASVLRVFHPGTKFDWMIIFEGEQGLGKSAFGRILADGKIYDPNKLLDNPDEYFLEGLPGLDDKDAVQNIQGRWFIEFGELDQLRRNEMETTKQYLTRTSDTYRPSYGRLTITRPRQCVFYGTTNRETYLKDDTGNRRFVPIRVGRLNQDQLMADRDQLFAEIMFIYENGLERNLYLEGEASSFALTAQKEKMVEDDSHLMREALESFFEENEKRPEDQKLDTRKFKISDLFHLPPFLGVPPLSKWRLETRNTMLAGKALKELGFEKWSSVGLKYWRRTKKT